MNLTPHFSLEELTRSQVAVRNEIENLPTLAQLGNLRKLCVVALEPTRALIGKPIQVTSGFRCPHVNRLVGGAATSQHTKGLAADIVVPGAQLGLVFTAIAKSDIQFDQLILEAGQWIHISVAPEDREPRREVLRATRKNGKWAYTKENL